MVMKKVPVSDPGSASAPGGASMMKLTKGRQKIEMKKIKEINSLQVAFSKRRTGLFKKASEICVLTEAQIAILVISPGGRIFVFGHPNPDVLFDCYPNNNNKEYSTTNNTAATQNSTPPLPMVNFNQHYIEVLRELEAEKKRGETIPVSSEGSCWFDEPVDGLDVEEVQQYLCSLDELKKKVLTRADEVTMINNSSAAFVGSSNNFQPVDIPTNTGVDGGLNVQYGEGFGNL
ncbi:agamous-like MADS-box protein AGL62 [Lactuca sativa]|uniref:agamous-like MADS-box protein AGL62 n=1 Tax=Lactuca sativa TaxID=4236 RepID=UPI000CD896E1|nr:agamous-like MADS-box protein AGL62 [Lactuca sativa]